MAKTTSAEWAKRVERWQDSGLTAKEFAAELNVNAGTLAYWKYKLRRKSASSESADRPGIHKAESTAGFYLFCRLLQLVPSRRLVSRSSSATGLSSVFRMTSTRQSSFVWCVRSYASGRARW
jgi:hypothetical protein